MKKRLRKKLWLEQGKVTFLRNCATFFCGEKKIIEYYQLLQAAHPQHPLLTCGAIKNDRFRFKKMSQMSKGVPRRGSDSIKYAHQLAGALYDDL